MIIKTGEDVRKKIRLNNLSGPTSGLAYGYTQANLAILPRKYALDFFIFCQRNPKSCPVLDVCEPGKFTPVLTAPTADIRTDISKYLIYRHGIMVEEVTDILSLWNDKLVSFLLGCSLTFESTLLDAGIGIRHIEENRKAPAYITNIECKAAGIFSGPMVVSMRPIPKELVEKTIEITGKFPMSHGAPIHVGFPEKIGIMDIMKPDFGDSVTIKKGELPVFWACGVTSQTAIMRVKPDLAITHAPGHMFVTDIKTENLTSI